MGIEVVVMGPIVVATTGAEVGVAKGANVGVITEVKILLVVAEVTESVDVVAEVVATVVEVVPWVETTVEVVDTVLVVAMEAGLIVGVKSLPNSNARALESLLPREATAAPTATDKAATNTSKTAMIHLIKDMPHIFVSW